MRLPAVPVTSFEDATLNAEALQTVLTSPSSQPFPFPQLPAAKQVTLASGVATITWPGGTNVQAVTITVGKFSTLLGVATFVNTSGLTAAYAYLQNVTPGSSGTMQAIVVATANPTAARQDQVHWMALVS